MKRWVFLSRVIFAAWTATISAAVRRLRHGSTLPSWTLAEECFVGASRAVATVAARNLAMMAPRHGGLRIPLGRADRSRLTIERVDLDRVPAERFRPKTTPLGTIVYFHGGGFVGGSVGLERRPAAANAIASHCDTYSIEYRLAPKHPYPAALDDAITAWRAVLRLGAEPSTSILLGGSAGACLALSTLLRIRELGLPRPAGAVLLWPYADFTFSGETIRTNADFDMLPVRDLAHIWGPAYVGAANPSDPLVSPALADLTDLPPLLIVAGGAESLLSCAEQIATNARRADVAVQLSVYPEKVHGWMLLPKLPATLQAVSEVNAWIAARLDASRHQ